MDVQVQISHINKGFYCIRMNRQHCNACTTVCFRFIRLLHTYMTTCISSYKYRVICMRPKWGRRVFSHACRCRYCSSSQPRSCMHQKSLYFIDLLTCVLDVLRHRSSSAHARTRTRSNKPYKIRVLCAPSITHPQKSHIK